MHSTIRTALPSGDLDIEALLAFHRATFGDARMEGDDEGSDDTDDGDDKGDDGADKLGDAGKQALDRMKARARTERDKRRDLERQLNDLKTAKAKDGEPTADEIREQAREEAKAEILRERVADKIEAKAGARFSVKPERIAAMLLRENDADDFIDGGKVDADAIAEALDKLLEEEPQLAAQGGKRFKGTADGGTRKETPAKPTSLNDAIAARLSQSRTGT